MPSAQKRRLPHVVTLLTQEGNTTKTQEGDSKYALSTEYDCDPRKLASYGGSSWCFREPWEAAEYQLTKLPCHNHSNIHTVQVGGITYAAKLSENPEAIKRERQATRDFYEYTKILRQKEAQDRDAVTRANSIAVPIDSMGLLRPISRISCPMSSIMMDDIGHDIATAGYVTSFIPPFQPATVRALVGTFIDSSIRDSVKNDPNLSNVRLRVHLGMMAPPDDPLSTRLLSRPVYLDQLQHEAEQDLEIWCEKMGVALAILHWRCSLDAAGVKFYLAPEERGHTKLWMADFGDCKPLQPCQDETKAMAKAVYNNTVWPRPPLKRDNADGEKYRLKMCAYESFIRAYATASDNILSQDSPEYIKRYPARISRKLHLMSSGPSPTLDEIQDKLDKLQKSSLKFWKRKAT